MKKRIFDLFVILVLSPIVLPLLLVITLILICNTGFPIFFKHSRPGQNGKLFTMIKFRTMTNQRSSDGKLKLDSERLTKFGKFLRSMSLDELPELWNVLKGDMSLVGPRPLLIEYLPLYSKSQARRHEIKPGITGWAQINGRNTISWSQKFQLDVWYVDNMSIWLDIKILCLTIKKVIMREGINQPGHSTIEAFRGNDGKE
tara:strand:+ start:2352 stop:2954 length:603 start_codon:yes stop_codon:yes gene_type:complete